MPARPAGSRAASAVELTAALGGSITSATAVAEVTRRLMDYFTGGTVAPGERLPPERQLATSMGVGRSAVREALAALEILGVVDVRPGSGTYLRGRISELLPQTLSWGMLLGEPKTRELIGVRHGLEVQAARLAAPLIDDDRLRAVGDHLETMRTSTESLSEFVAADICFHQEIAVAAQNPLLDEMLQSVRSLIRVWVERALDDSDHARLTYDEHAAILVALQQHDPDAAAEAMSRHMDSARLRLISSLETA